MAYETLTKLQGAERHLRVAIRLFFEDRDLVAVHTLAAAALEVLHDLGRGRGLGSALKDNPDIRPDKKAEVARLFSAAQNFFKHGARDPNKKLKFYYETTQFYLLDAALLYVRLTGQQFPEVTVLLLWSAAKFRDLLVEGAFKDLIVSHAAKIDPDDHQLLLKMIDHLTTSGSGRTPSP